MERSKMKKVLCPVEGKNGKTHWVRLGAAFENRDGSMNVYLDAYPANGKLQIRAYDDDHKQPNDHFNRNHVNSAEGATDALPF